MVSVADPAAPDADPVVALELGRRAAEHRRFGRRRRRRAVSAARQVDCLVVRAAALLVAGVAAVGHVVALPPEGDALLAATLEHPLVAVAAREVGRRRRHRLCGNGTGSAAARHGDVAAVELVAGVGAVGGAVALPRAEDAVAALAPELPVLIKTGSF